MRETKTLFTYGCTQFEQESEMHRLRQKLADLELQLVESRRSEIQAREERDLERLRNAMSPNRTPTSTSPNEELLNGVTLFTSNIIYSRTCVIRPL